MRHVVSAILFSAALASCSVTDQAKLDNAVVKITASVQQYCLALQLASGIAAEMNKKTVVQQINAGITSYCDPTVPVTDVPTAIVKLATVLRNVVNAGVPIQIPVAKN